MHKGEIMNTQTFKDAVALAEKRQHVFMSTIDRMGMPHIASAGSFRRVGNRQVALGDWYCPATLLNLQYNNQLAMVVWDIVTDTGYQLLGKVEAISAGDPLNNPNDQELVIRVDKVLEFRHASHTDIERPEDSQGLLTAEQESVSGNNSLGVDANWQDAYLYLKQGAAEP